MTRREWLASLGTALGAAPLVKSALADTAPASPVSIARCPSYNDDVTAVLGGMFDQLGGMEHLVRNKTVVIKINMTGAPSNRLNGMAPAVTHYVHPKVLGAAAYLLGRAGARRIRFAESPWATTAPLEEVMLDSGWNVRSLQSAAQGVEFANTNFIGKYKGYARFTVPAKPYMYAAYDLNRAYEEADVFVSIAKLKNHAICGVTLSIKNCFGCLPASVYGDDAGAGEPNENPGAGRLRVGHEGRRQPSKSAPQELHFGANHDPGYRVPRIVADLAAARPIHLSIIDGVQSVAGGEGPWIRGLRVVQPGLLIAGLNAVSTDAVSTAVMGYNSRATRGTAPFPDCDNTLLLAEALGAGSADLRRIEVRGLAIDKAIYRYGS